jgi:hypothetical protein
MLIARRVHETYVRLIMLLPVCVVYIGGIVNNRDNFVISTERTCCRISFVKKSISSSNSVWLHVLYPTCACLTQSTCSFSESATRELPNTSHSGPRQQLLNSTKLHHEVSNHLIKLLRAYVEECIISTGSTSRSYVHGLLCRVTSRRPLNDMSSSESSVLREKIYKGGCL